MFYEVEMLDTQTGKQHRFQMDRSIGWIDGPKGSIWGWQNRMCECAMHPYFAALEIHEKSDGKSPLYANADGEGGLINRPNWRSAYNYRYPCDHNMTPNRYQALSAHLPDGRVIDLKTGAVLQKARAA